jgi:hypothetical protein
MQAGSTINNLFDFFSIFYYVLLIVIYKFIDFFARTTEEELKIMTNMDELHSEYPFRGQGILRQNFKDHCYHIGRKRNMRLIRFMGICKLPRQ